MSLIRCSSSFLFLASLVALAPTALAQSDDESRARGHFEAASSYFEEGEYEDALREFSRAYDLSQRPGLLYNIGLAHERLGHYEEAARFLRQYLSEETREIPNRSALEHRVEALERRAATGAEEAEDPDAAPEPAESEPVAAPPVATSSGGTDLTVPAIVSFAVGGAGLALFAIAGGLALDGYASLESGCGAMRACSEDAVSGVRVAAGLADAGIALAAIGVAVGVVLILVSSPGESSSDTAAAALQVGGWADPSGGVIALGGTL